MDNQAKQALTIEELEETLTTEIVTPAFKRQILRDNDFKALQTRNEQLFYLATNPNNNLTTKLNNNQLSRLFGITKNNVAHIKCHMKKQKKSRGNQQSLSNEQEKDVILHIQNEASLQHYMTKRDVITYVNETYQLNVTRGWLFTFLERNQESLGIAHAVPRETTRLKVPREHLEKIIMLYKEHVNLKPGELVLNIDETGNSDVEAKSNFTVIVPKDLSGETLHYPFERGVHHQTFEVCISASGEHLIPLAIVSEKRCFDIYNSGIRIGNEINVTYKSSQYMNEELFYQYTQDEIIPYITRKRESLQLPHTKAVLMMDNCSLHCSQRILNLLTENGILCITFPPHTSHIFQMLDLVTFPVMKSVYRTMKHTSNLNPAADSLYRSIAALQTALLPKTVRGAFEKGGFTQIYTDGYYLLNFNEEKLRFSKDFKETFDIDFPISQLTQRQLNQTWGILNTDLLEDNNWE